MFLHYHIFSPRLTNADSWNDEVVKLAWDENDDPRKPSYVYAASKTEGERFAFKWVKEHNPHFTLNTVLPNLAVSAAIWLPYICLPVPTRTIPTPGLYSCWCE